jgi:hypothetical protein
MLRIPCLQWVAISLLLQGPTWGSMATDWPVQWVLKVAMWWQFLQTRWQDICCLCRLFLSWKMSLIACCPLLELSKLESVLSKSARAWSMRFRWHFACVLAISIISASWPRVGSTWKSQSINYSSFTTGSPEAWKQLMSLQLPTSQVAASSSRRQTYQPRPSPGSTALSSRGLAAASWSGT